MTDGGIDRREFLKGAAATVALMFAAEELFAEDAAAEAPIAGPAVKIGVIGLGQWGKEIVTALSRIPSASVTAICDTYDPYVKRAAKSAPSAAAFADYRKLLESPEVEAVLIATPSHLHKEITLAAIQVGKHVYCEAPLASTIDEARAIALAGQGSKRVFQVGLQGRSNLLFKHVEKFVRSGCLANVAQVYGQSNKKQSWQRTAPSPDREKDLNWRLHQATSSGLAGEIGIHQLDLANWFLNGLATAVSGYGSTIHWKDDRDVPDTVQCVLEYPRDVRMVYMATLVSSFGAEYTLFEGSDSSLALRENRGWMVKEADSPLVGWEVYARKEQVFEETGIAMVADATKIIKAGKDPAKEASVEPSKQPLYCALENFTRSIRENSTPACGAVEGFQAAVTAVTANKAILSASRITYKKEDFKLA